MSTVAADGKIPGTAYNAECVYTMSNGDKVVLYNDAANLNRYAVSTDAGATWATYATPVNFTVYNASTTLQVGNVLWTWGMASGVLIASSSAYNTGTHVLGVATAFSYPALLLGAASQTVGLVTAAYDGVRFHVFYTVTSNVGAQGSQMLAASAAGDILTQVNLNFSSQYASSPVMASAGNAPALVYVLIPRTISGGTSNMYVLPLVYTGSAYNNTAFTPEIPFTVDNATEGINAIIDGSGKLDIVWTSAGTLSAMKRTGVGTYGAPIPLAMGVAANSTIALAFESSTGNLLCFFESIANSPNHDVYTVKRTAGTWGSPVNITATVSTATRKPSANRAIPAAIVDLIFQQGATLQYNAPAAAGPPTTPTITAPIGNIGTLTPTISALYVNLSPNDPQGGRKYEVRRHSDLVSMWASGDVAGSSAAGDAYGSVGAAATALSYGILYDVRVAQRDSLSSGGAGTYSAWSAWVSFTPYQPGVVTLTDLLIGATDVTVFPATLGSPQFQVIARWTQPASDAADKWKVRLYDSSSSVIVTESAVMALVPNLASGSSATSGIFSFALANSTTYFLSALFEDAVSGVWAESPHIQLTTSWVPPSPVTSFTVTNNDDDGIMTLGWALPANGVGGIPDTVSILLERFLPNAAAWETLSAGVLMTGWGDRLALPEAAVQYRVTTVSALGLTGTPVVGTGTLGGRCGFYTIWLTDAGLPSLSVAFGMMPGGFDPLKRLHNQVFTEAVPKGQSYPTTFSGFTDFRSMDGPITFYFPATDTLTSGALVDNYVNTLLPFIQIAHRQSDVIWRDRFSIIKGRIHNVAWGPDTNNPQDYQVSFVFREHEPLGMPLAGLLYNPIGYISGTPLGSASIGSFQPGEGAPGSP